MLSTDTRFPFCEMYLIQYPQKRNVGTGILGNPLYGDSTVGVLPGINIDIIWFRVSSS